MLGFLISTIAFSLVAYALDRHFNAKAADGQHSRKMLVLGIATACSIGAGWLTDQLDGDAALAEKRPSVAEVINGGDPIQIAKLLIGIN